MNRGQLVLVAGTVSLLIAATLAQNKAAVSDSEGAAKRTILHWRRSGTARS